MTGDGAVVREWACAFTGQMVYIYPLGAQSVTMGSNDLVDEHNAAIRQQAAEVERLTGDLKSALSREKTMTKTAMVIVARAEASEARAADLLKALEEVLPALDKAGAFWAGEIARAAIAAAKGETV